LIECEYLVDRPWGVLSQGERQRVLIGRALMSQPSLLILDEPCAGLDPAAREHFLQFIDRLAKGKFDFPAPALVLVTHHVEEIMPFFTHILFLKNGRKLCEGKIAEMLNDANLAGAFSAPMRLERQGERYSLSVGNHSRTIF
jgi:iron complex transport system ATP-binding protein